MAALPPSAIARARHVIHHDDIDGLKQLIAEFPESLSWQGDRDRGGLLGFATGAYGDAFGEQREQWFTRKACAEVLIDAGAVVTPAVIDGLLRSRAVGLLRLFHRKRLLPRTLKFFAALGDPDGVRAAPGASDRLTVNEALIVACRFKHEAVAALLLERAMALDAELGRHIDESVGRAGFITALIENEPVDLDEAKAIGPWRAFVTSQVLETLHRNDRTAFVNWLQRESWVLGDAYVWFQNRIIELTAFATFLTDRESFIAALFEHDPAILHQTPPPPSAAIEHAMTYANTHLIPLLTRIWPLPDDLPHAAGMGNLARVKQWLEMSPPLGDPGRHFPANDERARRDLHWNPITAQHVLDVALAYAVVNRHFDVADLLLQHGANVNTDWNSHEPASILHHLVFQPDPYEPMQFLIDRGIDLSIRDYRWDATAKGWAMHALQDEEMVRFLEAAEAQRAQRSN